MATRPHAVSAGVLDTSSSAPPPDALLEVESARGAPALAPRWRALLRAGWAEFIDANAPMLYAISRPGFFLSWGVFWCVLLPGVAYGLDGAAGARVMATFTAAWLAVVVAYLAAASARWAQPPSNRVALYLAPALATHLAHLGAATCAPAHTALMLLALEISLTMLHSMGNPVGLRFPVWSALPALASLLVAPLAAHHGRLPLVAGGGLVASSLGLFVASFAERIHRAHAERAKLLAALEAQRATEGALDAQRALGVLESVLGHAHDALSPLLAARATTALLAATMDERGDDDDELRGPVTALTESLERVAAQLGAGREAARGYLREHFADAAVLECAARVVSEQSARFPGVALRVVASEGARTCRVRMFQGAESLERVIANLVVNACEGDARGRARAVWVLVRADGSVVVRDDGPGFAALQDEPGNAPLGGSAAKPGGLGLGLFTVARLVRASGGALYRSNRPDGGAEVEVRLSAF